MKESTIRSKIKKVFHYLQGRNKWRARFKHLNYANKKTPVGWKELQAEEVLKWAEKNIGNKNVEKSFLKEFNISPGGRLFTKTEVFYMLPFQWLKQYSPLNPDYDRRTN